MSETVRIAKGFVCSTDFDTELSNGQDARICGSLENLREHKSCVRDSKEPDLECGVYEVEIRVVRVVKEPNW